MAMEMGIHVARLVMVLVGFFIPELFLLNRKGKPLLISKYQYKENMLQGALTAMALKGHVTLKVSDGILRSFCAAWKYNLICARLFWGKRKKAEGQQIC